MKTHHALMDGMKGADLSVILCDLEPDPVDAPRPLVPANPGDESPGELEQAIEGLANLALLPARATGYGLSALRRAANVVPYVLEHGSEGLPNVAPRLSFNGEVGPHRAVAFTSLPLDEVKAVKERLGVKLNDVVIALCGSAMRTYAERNGEAPGTSLTVSCPVSTRAPGDRESSNRVANMIVSCATDIDDPARRVLAIHHNACLAKEITGRLRASPIPSLGDVFPPVFVNLGFRALTTLAEIAGTVPANAVVSNVPGPPVPLYIAGARVDGVFPISVLAPTQGLNFTAASFIGRLDIGITVDPDLVPDPWQIADCVDQAFAELRRERSPIAEKVEPPDSPRRAAA